MAALLELCARQRALYEVKLAQLARSPRVWPVGAHQSLGSLAIGRQPVYMRSCTEARQGTERLPILRRLGRNNRTARWAEIPVHNGWHPVRPHTLATILRQNSPNNRSNGKPFATTVTREPTHPVFEPEWNLNHRTDPSFPFETAYYGQSSIAITQSCRYFSVGMTTDSADITDLFHPSLSVISALSVVPFSPSIATGQPGRLSCKTARPLRRSKARTNAVSVRTGAPGLAGSTSAFSSSSSRFSPALRSRTSSASLI